MDKLNFIAANLAEDDEDPVLKSQPDEPGGEETAPAPGGGGPGRFFSPLVSPVTH